METFPPTNPFHHHLPQAMFQQYDLHAPSFASGPRHSAIDHHGSSSGQPSTSATTPALFSPSLFAPSPLTPSGGPLGGSYFSALGDSMGVSFGLLQQQQQQHNSAFAAAQANAFFVAQQQQQQYQLERLLSSPASRFEVLDDGAVDGRPQQQQQPAPAAFWSTSPPPPQRTASLHEFETASAADGGTGGRASTASSSSYSVSTPAVSDDDDGAYAFADVRAVDDAERGHLPGLDVPGAAGAQPARDDRAGSEHSDAALRSADGKGCVLLSPSLAPVSSSALESSR